MMALFISDRVDWKDDAGEGSEAFPVRQATRESRYQDFVRWLGLRAADRVVFVIDAADAGCRRFQSYLLAWGSQNDIEIKQFDTKTVRKWLRADITAAGLYEYGLKHR